MDIPCFLDQSKLSGYTVEHRAACIVTARLSSERKLLRKMRNFAKIFFRTLLTF